VLSIGRAFAAATGSGGGIASPPATRAEVLLLVARAHEHEELRDEEARTLAEIERNSVRSPWRS
jgi:hypothetical protein